MTPAEGYGGMLLITEQEDENFAARFLMQVQFIPCIGARNEVTAQKLTDAFRRGNWNKVRSLHRNNEPDESCWCAGPDWWLSMR
jgi:protein-L-isoaspartate(D-aspartate) O-methyltransferase